MIDHNNGFVPVQFFGKLGGGFSSFMNLFCEGGIFASDYVELIIDQNRFIFQYMNIGIFKKFFHAGIFYVGKISIFMFKGKACKNFFIQIMISPAGIYTISGLYATKSFFKFFRVSNRIVFIIKNIPCNTYQIRFLFIDLTYQFSGMENADIVAKMCICQKNNFHGGALRNCFIYYYVIRSCFYIFGMKNSTCT